MTADFFELSAEQLAEYAQQQDMPRFLADQLLDWVYRKGVVDPEAMTNVAKRHRQVIAETLRFYTGAVIEQQVADDDTQKLLIGWHERSSSGKAQAPLLPIAGERSERQTECVMIPADDRRTACVSSQVGCPVGCTFCASGIGGLEGNLSAGRIVEQVHRLAVLQGAERITNVVFMGMGEPLANLDAVTTAIRTLHAPWGFGISARRITVSTVGLPAAIHRFSAFELPVTLALSLHAPNDELRRQLIPWAEYATIEELIDACDAWFRKTGREITLEYLLLREVNDRPQHARELAVVAKRLRANVNLIRYNEVRGLPYSRPSAEDVRTFQAILRKQKVNAHLRASRGRTIAAACGQLRHENRTG